MMTTNPAGNAKPLAVVLAAGKGTRMKTELPKVLCKVCDRPMVMWVIDALRNAGVGKILVVIGYRGDLVRESLQEYPDLEFVEQTEQLGTGHAVMVCRDQLIGFDGPVLVVAGDSPMLQADSIRRLLGEYAPGRTACVLGTLVHDNPAGLGRIVRDESGQFSAIVEEKDCTDAQRAIREVNMSTYLFDNRKMLVGLDSLNTENRQAEYYLTDVPAILLQQGYEVRALPVLRPCEALSINTVDQLKLVEAEMRRCAVQ